MFLNSHFAYRSCSLRNMVSMPLNSCRLRLAFVNRTYYTMTPRKAAQQNRTCCGFGWFNVLKALCAGTEACAFHAQPPSGGFEDYYTIYGRPVYRRGAAITLQFL